jgi:hypothetical protein
VQKITFHEFNISDVEEVEVYAAYPINQWITTTDKGKWVFEHCKDLTWHSRPNANYRWTITIRGSLTDCHATEYYLRFPD